MATGLVTLVLWLGLSLGLSLGMLLGEGVWGVAPAQAATQIKLSDITYEACPPEIGRGSVTSNGSTQPANCFLVHGTALNTSGKPLYDADVYGRIYDANNNSIIENRSRVGAIDQVPPGTSEFVLRISVPANQPTPLKLEQFKAVGFGGKVKVNLRPDVIDYGDEDEE